MMNRLISLVITALIRHFREQLQRKPNWTREEVLEALGAARELAREDLRCPNPNCPHEML